MSSHIYYSKIIESFSCTNCLLQTSCLTAAVNLAMAPVFVAGKTSIQAFDFDTKSLAENLQDVGLAKNKHMTAHVENQ